MSSQDKIDAAIMLLVSVVWGAILVYATFIRPGPDTLAIAQIATPVIIAVIGWRSAALYLRKRPNGKGRNGDET